MKLIMAVDRNLGIAKNGNIPWHLPNDLKYFQAMTEDTVVIMGRKTYEAIGKPLPNRINVILTRQELNIDGVVVVHNPWFVSRMITPIAEDAGTQVFCIGGNEIIKEFVNDIDIIHLTLINHDFECDTRMDAINLDNFELIEEKQGIKDEKNPYEHYFLVYKRKEKLNENNV